MVEKTLDGIEASLEQYHGLLDRESHLSGPDQGIGRDLSRRRRSHTAARGAVLRAAGVAYDVRKADPYSIYDRFRLRRPRREDGDVYDRYIGPHAGDRGEHQDRPPGARRRIPGKGRSLGKLPRRLKPPEGAERLRPRGIAPRRPGLLLVSDGTDQPTG